VFSLISTSTMLGEFSPNPFPQLNIVA
jgi:hypothetical protein